MLEQAEPPAPLLAGSTAAASQPQQQQQQQPTTTIIIVMRRSSPLPRRLRVTAVPCCSTTTTTTTTGLLLLLLHLMTVLVTASTSMAELAELKPFRILGAWLDEHEASDLKGAGAGNIERAFKVVASSQQALKTMDGAAHGLYAYSKAGGDPGKAARAWTRLEYSRATRAEKEARLKAFRKARLLEEAVYSAELAEATAEGLGRGDALGCVRELQSPHEVLLEDFATVQGGRFRFLLLADPAGRRLTLSVGDAVGDWTEKLDVVRAPPLTVALRSRGLLRRTMNVNPRLWAAAVAIVGRVRPVLAAALKGPHQGYDVHLVGFSLGAGVAALAGGMLDGVIAPALPPPPPPSPPKEEPAAGEAPAEGASDGGVRAGAGAAAAAAAARRRGAKARGAGVHDEDVEGGKPSREAMQALHGAIGLVRFAFVGAVGWGGSR
jgi:hypothetical protein